MGKRETGFFRRVSEDAEKDNFSFPQLPVLFIKVFVTNSALTIR